jgi:hypothetical protein
MPSNLDRYKKDLQSLIKRGHEMSLDLIYPILAESKSLSAEEKKEAKAVEGKFAGDYQKWYTEATAVIRQIIPDRLDEFVSFYAPDSRRKSVDAMTFSIQDWLTGRRSNVDAIYKKKYFDDAGVVATKFQTQLQILEAVESRFESSLFEIRQLVQADLFDNELGAARELAKHGYLRAAGAISGVVLEKHLGEVCGNHKLATRKKHPTISEFNDLLKGGSVIDVPTWRQIQRLGDLRNLCDHPKGRDPTSDEIEELISGTEKLTHSIF